VLGEMVLIFLLKLSLGNFLGPTVVAKLAILADRVIFSAGEFQPANLVHGGDN